MKIMARNKVIVLFFFMIVIQSCKDIIEQDISKSELHVISPADNYRSDKYDVTFWWDKVEGARKYRIQIAIPSFDSLQKLFLDTSTTDTRYILTLFPGVYQWRIRAENGTSFTPFITRKIVIDSNTALTGQTFNVDYPANSYYTNNDIVSFGWQSFPGANLYEYILSDTNNIPLKNKETMALTVLDTLFEGSFLWKVRAVNKINNTMTGYSLQRHIYIDKTAPSVSVQIHPSNQTLLPNPIQLQWSRPNDVYADSIIIASDSSFSNIVSRHLNNSSSSINLSPLTINNTYYWRIRSSDRAGNWSVYSNFFSFTVTF